MDTAEQILERLDVDNLSPQECQIFYDVFRQAIPANERFQLETMLLAGYPPSAFMNQPSAKGIPEKLQQAIVKALAWKKSQLLPNAG